MFRKVVEGSMYLLVGIFVAKFLSVIYTFMLARALGPAGMGAFSLSLLISTWISAVALLSIQTVSTQLISESKEKAQIPSIITAAIVIGLISGMIGLTINFVLAEYVAVNIFHDTSLTNYIRLSSLLVLGAVLYNAILGVERGLKRFGRYALIDSSKQASMVAIGFILLVGLGYKVGGAIWAVIIAQFAIIAVVLVRYMKYFTLKFTKVLKRFLTLSGWLTVLALLMALFISLDKFFLGSILTKESVGLYVPAITIITFLGLFLTSSIKNAALPFIVESYASDKIHQIKQYFHKTLRYYLSILGYLLIIGMFFKTEIIYVLFGKQYLPASAELLGLLLFATVFYAMYILLHTFLIGMNKSKEASVAVLFVIIISIITYSLFIRTFGLTGAAIATVINVFVFAMVYLYQVYRLIKPSLRKIILLVIVINAFLLLAFKISADLATNILFALIFIGLYSLFIFGTRCLTRRDIMFVLDKIKAFKSFSKKN